MYVYIRNNFHNTVARVRYNGGEQPVPKGALRKLCPWKNCKCMSTSVGHPFVDNFEADICYTERGWVLRPWELGIAPIFHTRR